MAAHPKCQGPGGHVCMRPSGRECIEPGCENTAGTVWGPLWCPDCDQARLDRVSAGFDAVADLSSNQGELF